MEIVRTNRKAFVILVTTLSAVALAGFVATASLKDERLMTYQPNDRANHHLLHPAN